MIYFPSTDADVNWAHGEVLYAERTASSLNEQVGRISDDAEWVLFWDAENDLPPADLIQELAAQPVDVFHAGLKQCTRGLPDALNYMHPTWMYNIDGSNDITHTNFRMSLSAAMVRRSVLQQCGSISNWYKDLCMAGIDYGYRVLKQGGIIRYHADLLAGNDKDHGTVPLYDELVFARSYFPARWQLWMLLNKSGFLNNIKEWRATRHVAGVQLKPLLHSSQKTDVPVHGATVSVLAPTLDRYPYLEEELRELNLQTILPHEVLITDQTDKERRQAIDFTKYPGLNIKYFPQDEKGQCLAWNKLIEEATGEYVFFFGDDAYDIKPDLIEKMLQTMQRFNADMVASNVREVGIVYPPANHHYYLSDSFPITLIRKSVVVRAGGMDMFFNRNVKADHDLAMRCHLNGALMIFDPSAEIGHHRAPSGGLRTHNARVVTNFMAKNTITKIVNPSASEIYIYKRYYSSKQFIAHVRIKYMNQVLVNGSFFKKLVRMMYMLYKIPAMRKAYKTNLAAANAELEKKGVLK